MTPTQVDIIGQLKDKILADDSKGRDGWVYRKFHAQEFDGERWVVLWAITGHEDDEGSLAELLYRKEHLVWVGPRGRVLELNRPEPKTPDPVLSLPVALKERLPKRNRPSSVQHLVRAGAA